MSDDSSSKERRQFQRLNAPVLCRPLGRSPMHPDEKRQVEDISVGGVRVFTDDQHRVGERLELELWLPSGESINLDTQVVWIEPLKELDAPARYEIGLKYVDVAEADLERLKAVLKEV